MVEGGKSFSVIGNKNAITYKEVFPLIKENKMWMGSTSMSMDMLFRVPDNIADKLVASGREGSAWRRVNGEVLGRSTSVWFSSIEHGRRHQPLSLMTQEENLRFNKAVKDVGYQKYDNYDAIEVPRTDAIPSDYDGVMGVPISFLDKYNPDQFEIFGFWNNGQAGDEIGANRTPAFSAGKKIFWNGPTVNGETKYFRILVRHKETIR